MMHRQNNVPFNPPVKAQVLHIQQQRGRLPQNFQEAMLHTTVKRADNLNRTSDMAANTQQAQKRSGKSAVDKWASSFKPQGGKDHSPDTRTGSSEKVTIYDPYDPFLSDYEQEVTHDRFPSIQDNNLGRRSLSPSESCHKKGRWDISYSELVKQSLNSRDFSPESRPNKSQGLSPGHRLPEQHSYNPNTESLDRLGYDSISRHLVNRVCNPDRLIPGSFAQQFPTFYGGQRTNGEDRMIIPEYRREMTTTVRSSPPRLQQDYQPPLECGGTALDQITTPTEVPRNRNINIIMDKRPIICDLCDVELANGPELEDHLESKSHWDTLAHIQQQHNYDDLAIAFLQEVMLYKSQQCSRTIEDSALQALEENDHMTKIEMFHCAACRLFVSTSASSVQTHITSREHLSNTKEFQMQQRRSCLEKAETMMKELKPQFEHFLKGGSPFQ